MDPHGADPGKKAQVRRIPLGALQEREFRLFFTGQLVSLLGDAVTPSARAWAVLDLTGSARDLGFVLAAKIAPLVVFLLIGGVFADRLPRRAVMLTADVARMAVQAATAALLLSHTARIWELVVLQALAGTGTAFFNPASTGLTPMIVSAGRLQEANALRGMSMASTQFAGPALVGGWREFTARTWVWLTVVSVSLANMMGSVWLVLAAVWIKNGHGGASAWTVILVVSAIGALVAGATALRLKPRRPLLLGTIAVIPNAAPIIVLALELPWQILVVTAL